MKKQKKVEYWCDIADYDLETAKAMFTSGGINTSTETVEFFNKLSAHYIKQSLS